MNNRTLFAAACIALATMSAAHANSENASSESSNAVTAGPVVVETYVTLDALASTADPAGVGSAIYSPFAGLSTATLASESVRSPRASKSDEPDLMLTWIAVFAGMGAVGCILRRG